MQTHIKTLVVAFVIASIATGCSSMKTTFFTRHEDDTLCKETEHPINGVPIMLKVPSHLEVKIQETIHIVQQPDTANIEILNYSGRAIRTVEPCLRFTEKMFVVDPTRPFSGTASYGFTFRGGADAAGKANAESGHGYLNKARYIVDDETITNVTTLLASIAPILGIGVGGGTERAPKAINAVPGVQTTKRTIAYGLFDLNSPSFENEVTMFMETHLNQCSPCDAASSSIPASAKSFKPIVSEPCS